MPPRHDLGSSGSDWHGRVAAERIPIPCVVSHGIFPEDFVVALTVSGKSYVTEAQQGFITVTSEPNQRGEMEARLWVRIRRSHPSGYIIELPEETFTSGELLVLPRDAYEEALQVKQQLAR